MRNLTMQVGTVITLMFLVLCFANCGRVGNPETWAAYGSNESASEKICTEEAIEVYSRTYYPFLVQNCASCHSNKHASADIETSFSYFTDFYELEVSGTPYIEYQATHAHNGNSNGPQFQPAIDAFKAEWVAAKAAYDSCLAQAPTPTPTPTATPTPNPSATPTPTPAPGGSITWTELISTDVTKGVFGNTCNSCHGNATTYGDVNLEDYNQAKSNASKIISEINSNKMPFGAPRLSAAQKALVQEWVTNGMPQ